MIPARNAGDDLVHCLRSAALIADAVIGLDDGSTDDTRDVFHRDPRVTTVLTNPRRGDYRAWDDAANRRRLLEATAGLEPQWVLWLDADERIPPDDAVALRRFLETDALPGCAYGFRHFRMWGDECDPEFTWIYRLFSFRPDQTLPSKRLHFNPIPTQIPFEQWIPTTVRVQHFGSSSEARMRAHVDKYAQADPEANFGENFGGLAQPPKELQPWQPRPAGWPVLEPPTESPADPLAEEA